jgi:hypothetical protein
VAAKAFSDQITAERLAAENGPTIDRKAETPRVPDLEAPVPE